MKLRRKEPRLGPHPELLSFRCQQCGHVTTLVVEGRALVGRPLFDRESLQASHLGLGQVDLAQGGSRQKWQSFAVLTIDLGMLEMTIRLAVLLLLLGMSVSSAQENGPGALEQRGQALAERMCSQCHAIGKRDQSSHSAAPPFRALDQRLELDSFMDRLREGLMVGHPDMPMFRFTREDARAFVLYLRSIRAP
jgi:cytochrome c